MNVIKMFSTLFLVIETYVLKLIKKIYIEKRQTTKIANEIQNTFEKI